MRDVPIGAMIQWLGSLTEIPPGWVLGGTYINITEYPELYNILNAEQTLTVKNDEFQVPSITYTVGSFTVYTLFRAKG